MFIDTKELLTQHGGLIFVCFLLIFFSAFGQSVFIGVYLPTIQEELNISKTTIGALYATATIASSIVIIFTGKALDHYPLRNFIAIVLIGLAVGCFSMAHVNSTITLLITFFMLRQFGQGLMVLSSGASINRYLDKNRGKAVSLTNLGSSFQLMVFPLAALTLGQYIDWRDMWNIYGLFVLFILLPGFWLYLKSHQTKRHNVWKDNLEKETVNTPETKTDHWSRKRVLGDWRFWGLISITFISPFAGTAIFFYQIDLAQSLNLTPISFAASFPIFTSAAIAASLFIGVIIDKYGEKLALVSSPIIYTIGLFLLTSGQELIIIYVGMAFIGAAVGIMGTIGGPILAKLYGTKHLGSIKSMLFSSSILASALSPFIFGLLMDQGEGMTTLLQYVAYYSGIVWIFAFPICAERKTVTATS